MILSDIDNKRTLRAIERHNITVSDLEKFKNIDELRYHILLDSNRKWQKNNKAYFRKKMLEKYHNDPEYRQKTIENVYKQNQKLREEIEILV